MAAGSSDRLVGLDLWRAMLMAAGLLVHGSIWLDTRPLFAWAIYVSSGTRMGVFFAVAGFLAARGLRGRSVRGWCERRLMQLLPPTIFGLAVLCPTIALLHVAHTGDPGSYWVEAAKLHHIWFLVALCLYTGVAAVAWQLWTRFADCARMPAGLLLPATALAGMAIAVGVHVALSAAPGGRAGLWWEERRMLVHLPVFVMGLALGRREAGAWQRSGGALLPLALLLLVFGWRVATAPWLHDGTLGRVLADIDEILRLAVSPPAAALLVLRSAAAIRRVPAWLDRAAAAALTLYLLHVPLILVAHLAMAPWRLDPHVQFVVAIAASGIVAYHFHHRVVARVPMLAFVINGVPLARRGSHPSAFAA